MKTWLSRLLYKMKRWADWETFYKEKGARIYSDEIRHKIIAKYVIGGRVLDYGCGTGDLLLLLQKKQPKWDLLGIDVSWTALDICKGRGFKGRLQQDDQIPREIWNTVVFAHVLEHVLYPEELMKAIGDQVISRVIVSLPLGAAIDEEKHQHVIDEDEMLYLLSLVGEPSIAYKDEKLMIGISDIIEWEV